RLPLLLSAPPFPYTTLFRSHLAASRDVAESFPVLAEAARGVASPLLRNMGTVGGNLCLDTRCLYYNQSEFWRGALGGCLKKDGEDRKSTRLNSSHGSTSYAV